MDPQRKILVEDSLDENPPAEKPLPRGLEEISRLFLSQSPDRPTEKAETSDIMPAQAPSDQTQSKSPYLLKEAPTVSRELILGFLKENTAVLEDGLRAIDANMPCDPFGLIDLVAMDSRNELCIINIDIDQKDESLLRGIACFDWFIRNTPIVRRMYQRCAINFSAQPRLFLVAPGFSPLLKCGARRSTCPKVICIAYRAIVMPGGTGILFEHA